MNTNIKIMSKLFPIKKITIDGHLNGTVDARELHTFLEVKRDFSSWFNGRTRQYNFIKNIHYIEINSPKRVDQKGRGGNRRSREYALSLDMAKELSMIERTEQGRFARNYFIECEKHISTVAPQQHLIALHNWQNARIDTRNNHKIMCRSLELSRARQGKDTKPKDYANEIRMLNRLLLGMNEKIWMEINRLNGDLRQHLNEKQLSKLAYLEKLNSELLDLDISYQERKLQLEKMN